MRELTYREAADHLNISPATLKNWTRQGLLSTVGNRYVPESELLRLKAAISGKKNKRLISRANKRAADGKFIPTEYIEKEISRKEINQLADILKTVKVRPPVFLLALTLKLTELSGLIENFDKCSIGIPEINHRGISSELQDWYKELNEPPLEDLLKFISEIKIPLQRDTPGLIYQMLQNEGRKSEKGSYYTPPSYADEVFRLYGEKGQKFLDPCCGTGMFLLAAAVKYGTPFNIYGWDTDRTAVRLARFNLMLHFKEIDFKPNIFLKNSLTGNTNEKFDLIASNPPWGHRFRKREKQRIKKRYKSITTGESFSYFIEAGINLLQKNGVISYLLPEALLKVKTHRDIREIILDKIHVKYVKFLGKPFFKVQTQVIRMDMEIGSENRKTTVFSDNRIYNVNCSRFSGNPFYLFDFNCNNRDYTIIEKVYSKPHRTLQNNAQWILGIVSGNNTKYISSVAKKDYLPFISGRDLNPFKITRPDRYIYFNRKVLQQSALGEHYRKSPKIVYKFITDKPVFAIDRQGYVTLNSANSFYPQLDIPAEIITALFNSNLYRFICRKKFNSIKVLRSHLEQLPVPEFQKEEIRYIKEIVTHMEKSENNMYDQHLEILNTFIFRYFQISDSDAQYIMENL